MKIALSSHQTPEYLEKADEIRVQYKDKEILYDFIEKYTDKTFILEIPFYIEEEKIDYQEIKAFSQMANSFMCRISRPQDIEKLQELNVKWYYGMIIDKWDDLICLSRTESEYVLIGGDLFFNLPKVKEFNIPVRAVPNVSQLPLLINNSSLEFDISIIGDWFAPEAVEIYEPYITTIEFENCSLQQERALYRIYSGNGWPGKLTQIITNLKTESDNQLINPEWFYPARLSCGRECLKRDNKGCQACYRQFTIANYEKLKEYKDFIDSESE